MKSGGQIDGHMSSQSPEVWWYREVNCEVVGMCVEMVPISGAESVDFLIN
jgi:(2Fe-2S) ferredoxin